MTVGGAGAALAGEKTPTLRSSTSSPEFYSGNGLTCNDFVTTLSDNVNINEGATGTYTGASGTWGTFGWVAGNVFTWAISAGWTVDLCIKGSNTVIWINDASGTGSYDFKGLQGHGISHMNFTDARFTPPTLQTSQSIDCTSAINGTGRPLVNGDHINMRVQYQGREIRLDSYVEQANRVGDPTSESGLLIRTTVDGVQFSVPLSNQQVASGLLVVNYSSYLTGSWTVTWVQYNERYAANLLPLTCGTQTPAATGDVNLGTATCELGAPFIVEASLTGVSNANGSVLKDGSQAGAVEVVFTATNNAIFSPSLAGVRDGKTYAVTNDGTTLTVTGTLPAANPALCSAATADVNVGAPTCELATPKIVDGDLSGAFASSVITNPAGSNGGMFSVVFTAADGSRFAADYQGTDDSLRYKVTDDGRTLTISGTLAGPDPTLCGAAFADLTLTAATCELGALAITKTSFAAATNAEGRIVDSGAEDRTFEVVFTATDGTRFASNFTGATRSLTYVVSDAGRTLTITGALAGPNAALCTAASGDVDVDPPTCELASPNIGAGDLSGNFASSVITNPVGSDGGKFSVVLTAADGTRFAADYRGTDESLTYEVTNNGRTLTISGTLAGPDATLCPPVATAAVTVVEPGCFNATTFAVNPAGTALATFADPVSNVNGTVSIVATATGNALFAAGNSTTEEGVEIVVNEARTTKTFTVTQDPQLPNNDPLCVQGFGSVELAFNAPKCETAETLNVGGFSFINARIKEGTLVQGNGTFQVTFEMTTAGVFDTNKTATQFAKDGRSVTFRYNENFRELTLSGVLAGPDIEDCIVIPVVDPFDSLDDCLLGQNYTLEFVNGITYMVTVDPDGQAGPQAPLAPFAVVFEPNQLVATLIPTPGSFVSVMPVANPGYVLAENQPKPFSRTFAVYGPNDCQLTDLPNWSASVSSTNESCTPLSKTSGVITVQRSTGPSENPNPVRYYLAFGTPQQVELTSATTAVAPGTYVVTAQAFLSTDSVNNSGRTLTFPALTVGAASDEDCELDTLAFTGAGEIVNWLGVAAVLMVLAGMGFVIRRHRVEV